MQRLPERLPLELQRALGTEVTRRGFPPIRNPGQCGDALLALERHRKHEMTCLLKIALLKLSPPRGTGHDARYPPNPMHRFPAPLTGARRHEEAQEEMQRLQSLLTRTPASKTPPAKTPHRAPSPSTSRRRASTASVTPSRSCASTDT
jgi:hypothetical protein